jgi:hypothetical protein
MARTRGASQFHQDEGVILGKGGVPIAPTIQTFSPPRAPLDRQGHYISPAASALAAPLALNGETVVEGPGAEPPPSPQEITAYRATAETWARNMEAWELARLLDVAFRHSADDLADGFVITLSPAEYVRLDANLRRHFMAVRG